MPPRLSIGLPVYNGAAYLAESLEALLSQDFGDFELIVADNASTDGSDGIAADFARRDRRLRFTRHSRNLGAAANFNYVFRCATAAYFKWACADDLAAPSFLGKAIAELEAHGEAVLCYGQTALIDEVGRPLGGHQQGLDLRSPDVVSRFRTAREYRGLLHVLQGVMRTSALRGTRLMGSFPSSDEALVVELTLRGTFREIAHPMLFRRMHAGAASADRRLEAVQWHLDPRSRRRIHMDTWRRSTEHLLGILRAPQPVRTRARLIRVVLGSMAAQRSALRWELTDAGRELIRRLFRRGLAPTHD